MAKMVGLSRNLKPAWLDMVADCSGKGLKETEVKEQLNEYLGFEIGSPTNLRKTREILMRIWFYENDSNEKLRDEALRLIKKYPDNSIEIHWMMMLAAYPVLGEISKLIAKIAEFQDEVTLAQLRQKLFDEWGERTTLLHSLDKIIATMKAIGVLEQGKPGKYTVVKKRVKKQEISIFMAYSMMCIGEKDSYSMTDIISSEYFFPFNLELQKADVLQDSRFTVVNIGGDVSIAIK